MAIPYSSEKFEAWVNATKRNIQVRNHENFDSRKGYSKEQNMLAHYQSYRQGSRVLSDRYSVQKKPSETRAFLLSKNNCNEMLQVLGRVVLCCYIKYISKREDKQMTTANTTAQLATFLNVSPNQIKSVTEMAWVFCVVVKGCRARFVSKKVVSTEEKMDFITAFNQEFGTKAKLWEKNGITRIYTNDRKLPAYFEVKNGVVQSHPAASAEMKAFIEANATLAVCAAAPVAKAQSFREHFLSQPSTKRDSWNAYHKANPVREYCFGAADEESY